jgi:hypothetical protein
VEIMTYDFVLLAMLSLAELESSSTTESITKVMQLVRFGRNNKCTCLLSSGLN